MSFNETLGPGDFSGGTKKRLPICFCLDVSGSMYGDRINQLNRALSVFVDTIKKNADALASVDVAIVTYGGIVEILRPFSQLKHQDIPTVEVRRRSQTPLGGGILVSLKLLEMRKQGYRDRGIKYYQPWLVIITDGKPEGQGAAEEMEQAIYELNRLESESKLMVYNIGVGNEADMNVLARTSIKRNAPIKVGETNLESLFEYLGSSSTSVVNGMDSSRLYEEDFNSVPQPDQFDISEWMI